MRRTSGGLNHASTPVTVSECVGSLVIALMAVLTSCPHAEELLCDMAFVGRQVNIRHLCEKLVVSPRISKDQKSGFPGGAWTWLGRFQESSGQRWD